MGILEEPDDRDVEAALPIAQEVPATAPAQIALLGREDLNIVDSGRVERLGMARLVRNGRPG